MPYKKSYIHCLCPIIFLAVLSKASGSKQASYKLLKKKTRGAITNLESNIGDTSDTVPVGVPRSKKVKAYRSKNHGIGYWAIAPINRGEILFKIPYNKCINFNVTKHAEGMTTLSKKIKALSGGNSILLALHLAISSRGYGLSNHTSYVQFLKITSPKLTSPIMWTSKQLEVLQASPTKRHVESIQKTISKAYNDIMLDDFVQSNYSRLIHDRTRLTLKEFKWFVASVWSRAFFVDMNGYMRLRKGQFMNLYDVESKDQKFIGIGADGKQKIYRKPKLIASERVVDHYRNPGYSIASSFPPSERLLIPVLGMLNHNRLSRHTYRFNTRTSMIEFTAMSDIEKGEEILFNYGLFSSSDLFIKYGFIDATSELDHLKVPAMQVKSVLLSYFKEKNVSSLALDSTTLPSLTVLTTGEVHQPKNFQKSMMAINNKLKNTRIERLVHDICKQALLAYHETPTMQKTSWWRLGHKVVAQEKRILGQCISKHKVRQ